MFFGLLVGIIANLVDSSPARGGIGGAILLGVIGALVGGFLANIIFGFSISGFSLPSVIIASLGALLLLFIGRAIRGA